MPRVKPKPKPKPKKLPAKVRGQRYARRKEASLKYGLKASASHRCIGFVESGPDDPARHARGRGSLEAFAREYFAARFFLPFAPFHLDAIRELEQAVLKGGRVILVLPRGSGKSALLLVAVLWAILHGFKKFIVVVAATDKLATDFLRDLQTELEVNDVLLADFAPACLPVRRLERIAHRTRGQTYWPASEGRKAEADRAAVPTYIAWGGDSFTLPTIDDAPSSGATVRTVGMTGAIRGLTATRPDGTAIRPDLILGDDVQTSEVAYSPTQVADRERKVLRDLLHLAGPTTAITCVLLGTVIAPGDLTSRFADRDRHASWRCVRARAVLSMPEDMAAWDAYAEVRRLALAEDDPGRVNDYYREHRAELEAGASVSWEARVKDGDLTALQSAMHVFIDDPGGFAAELQGEPQVPGAGAGMKELIPAEVVKRLSGSDRYVVPRECTRLTAGFDCSPSHLHWYTVTAWGEQGGGVVIDYGPWPAQARAQFEANDARPSLATLYAGHTPAQRVFAGLRDLTAAVLGREYQREGGGTLRVEKALVDSGDETASVYKFVRQSPYAGVLYPSRGFARTITQRGVGEWRARPGERAGPHWRLTLGEVGQTRAVQFDTDHWKSTLHAALNVPAGGPTGLTFFGKLSGDHAMLAEHLGAEYGEPATVRGISFTKWMIRPHRPDNHFWDALVLSAVAASVAGVRWEPTAPTPSGEPAPTSPAKKPIDFRELVMRNRALAAGRRR